MKKRIAWLALLAILPLTSYAGLLYWLHGGGSPLMLGATADSALTPILAMVMALGLRLYTVLVLPSLLVLLLLPGILRALRRVVQRR